MRTYEVVVIGAGVGGATTALLAARQGLSVLLVERSHFPRHKVCGCCLNSRAVALLRRHAKIDLYQLTGAPRLTHLDLSLCGAKVRFPLRGGLACARARLDLLLAQQAQHDGAELRCGVRAEVGQVRGAWREVVLHRGEARERIAARVVAFAGGLHGAGLPSELRASYYPARHVRVGVGAVVANSIAVSTGAIVMAVHDQGYVGMSVLEDRTLDIAAALEPSAIRGTRSVQEVVQGILDTAGLPLLPPIAWRGTPVFPRRRRRMAADRLIVLGDAASYLEPLSGEGMAWAIEGAVHAAALLPQAIRSPYPVLASQWERTYHRQIIAKQRPTQLLCSALRTPSALRAASFAFRHFPLLHAPLTRIFHHAGAA